jgi:hypothetical protein
MQRKYSNRRASHAVNFDSEWDKRGDRGGKVLQPLVLARMKELRDKTGRWVDS